MKQIKIAVASMIIAAGAYGAYAFSNASTEVKKAEVKYWVTGESATEYTVQTMEPEPSKNKCDLGSAKPCEIRTTASLTSPTSILKSDVHDPAQTQIDSQQPNF